MATKPHPKPTNTEPTDTQLDNVESDAPQAAPASGPSRTDRMSATGASFLGSLRVNRMGTLTAALVVAMVLALLLSVLVPRDPGALAMIVLGTLMAAAVGFTVRYLAHGKGLLTQLTAFVATVLGVHIMATTGLASGSIPGLDQLGVAGASFNQSLFVALATPALSAGGALAGLIAAIIVGWGPKPVGHIELD